MARALYIHWPFCLKKCPYCDFNSHVRDGVDHALWERAMLADMRHEHALADTGPLTSIFFGGGTPSLMPPSLVERLLEEAERLWGFDPQIEITLEANPSSVEADNFTDLARAGVNRVSLGLQSLDDETLRFLGRLHNVAESLAALDTAQSCFARTSFDLIYARPGQSAGMWRAELERALGFGTNHLSLYQLTIEPGTRFATDVRRGVFTPLEDDPAADLFALAQELTNAAGLPAYEVSNHAAPGQESRHNLTYWRYQDYIGIGPGAHGRRGCMATQRHRKPENWLDAIAANSNGLVEERALVAAESASEALMMGLRLREGIDLAGLSARFHIPESTLVDSERVAFYGNLGFLWDKDGRIGATPAGMAVLDALLGEVVSGELVAT
ncbi:MAG: coproporphyrinogen III oxidase [Sphingomonadaceae bacterium]|nr:coproporphyrinogen III oxidase [Sphingomonadaceae bacterium]MCP5394083.1 coproporphyrinogen III oxidase [Sphingomonadaceae bacterium]